MSSIVNRPTIPAGSLNIDDIIPVQEMSTGTHTFVTLRALLQALHDYTNSPAYDGSSRWGNGTSYAEFEPDGTLRFAGDATVWMDIDFPIIIRDIAANRPILTTLQGNITAPSWAVDDFLVCEVQELVHAWKEGSEMQWHLHFVTNGQEATDKYVRWELEWAWVRPNGQLSANTVHTVEMLIPANTPTRTMLQREIALVTLPTIITTHIYARLKRVASVRAAPLLNPWCSMLQLHIECDTLGSREIISKQNTP